MGVGWYSGGSTAPSGTYSSGDSGVIAGGSGEKVRSGVGMRGGGL